MRKPRMNKSEKVFVDAINKIIFATPEIRNGKEWADRKAFGQLSAPVQSYYLKLVSTKTR